MEDLLGYLGTILIILAYSPQTYKTLKTKNTEGISSNMYLIVILSSITWIIYSVMLNNYPLLICNGINLIQSLLIYRIIIKNNGRQL